jgi:hypothetical protein
MNACLEGLKVDLNWQRKKTKKDMQKTCKRINNLMLIIGGLLHM